MVHSIMLTSTASGAGKSVVAIGLYLKLKEMGHKMGYFKPIGDAMTRQEKSRTDKDVSVISAVVARKFSKEEICPHFMNPDVYLDEILPEDAKAVQEKIKDAFQSIAGKSEYIIVEGNHSYDQYLPVHLDDSFFAKELGAKVVVCASISDDEDINSVISAVEHLKSNDIPLLGVVLNARNKTAEVRIQKYHTKLLKELGIDVIGSLKNIRALEKPTVAEIMDATGGKLISGEFMKVKNNLIESFLVGAMGPEPAMRVFRANVDKCVITGGDRTDIALAALNTSTKLLIFSGGLRPVQRVLSVAQEKGIPIISCQSDTFTVVKQIRRIQTHIQPSEIQICRDQVESIDITRLLLAEGSD